MPPLRPQIKIGFLTFHPYGLIIAAAIYISYHLAKKRAKLYKIKPQIFDDPILLAPLALAIIGARLYHVLDYWSVYSQHPVEVLYITNGGLGIWGAIAGLILGLWLVCKARKINFLSALDLISPSFLLGQAIGRFGNYINQEGFGPPTSLPWGVYISPDHRPLIYQNFSHFHPTFFYEAALDFIFFIVLIYLAQKLKRGGLPRQNSHLEPSTNSSQKAKDKNRRGQLFSMYLIFYSLTRFISEFWRIDTATIGTLKVAHLLSVLAFLLGLALLLKSRNTLRT